MKYLRSNLSLNITRRKLCTSALTLPAVPGPLADRILQARAEVVDDVVALGQEVVGQGQTRQEDGGRGTMGPGQTYYIK